MAQTIQLKRSATAGNIPTSSDLALGEIAINTADGAVYIKKGNNDIVAVADNDILHIDTTNGRVGIGTTSPGTLLDIYQDAEAWLRITGGATDINGIRLGTGSGSRQNAFYRSRSTDLLTIRAGIDDSDIQIIAGGSSNEIMRFDGTNSRVGIGTTSPSVKFEVNGGSDAIAKITGTSTAARLDLATTTHHVFMQVIESDGRFRIYDQTAANEYLTISNAGNVGIGTSSPSANLAIVDGGSLTNTDGNNRLMIDTSGHSYIMLNSPDGYDQGIHFRNNTDGTMVGRIAYTHRSGGDSLLFRVAGSDRLGINSSGAVTFNSAYTFPTADGSANQVLQTDGSGNLSFATVSGGGGVTVSNNADNRVLTGDGTNANAEANLTFDGTNLTTTGAYIADTHFRSSDGNATLSATGGGGVYLRPNGYNSSTAQFIVEATTGNVTVAGTVDGRDIATDGTKLDGIESGATADQTQSDINALGITQVGTISSGTWQGTAIASAYLDSDTAHLSGSQTFSGAKTFSNALKVESGSNQVVLSTDGAVEITRSAGNPYIDFKDSISEDYDQRLQINSGNFNFSSALQVAGSTFIDTSRNITAGTVQATSFSDGTISGITFIDEDSFSTNSATRVPTQQSIKAYVDAQVAGVVDTAPAALNTLNELAAALGDDANFSTTTSTALGNRLRVDTASQGLTGTQQANAITNLGITATKAELNVLDGITATTTELNYTDGVTSNIQTQLNGKLSTSGTAVQATNLNATDDRDIAPEDLSYTDDLRIYFADKGGLETGTIGSNYQDVLVLNSYSDATGGDANALAFDKSEKKIYHYQADQAATNWGTAKTLAYTDSNISGTSAGLSGTPNISVGTISATGEINTTAGTPSRFNGGISVGADDDIYFYESATGTGTIRTGSSGAYKYFNFKSGGQFNAPVSFQVNGSEFIDSSRNITAGTISSGAISTSGTLDVNGNNIIDIEQLNGVGGSGWLDFNMDTDSVYPTGTTDNITVLGSITHHVFVGDSNGNGTGGLFYWGYGVGSTDSGTFTQTMALDRSGNLTLSGTVDGRDVAADGSKLDGIEAGATADQTLGDLGITATAAELNVLDGYTGSVTELNYLDTLHATGVTSTEFDYLDGVTSNIQTQLNGKLGTADIAANSQQLDGIDSSQFLRSDTSDTMTGTLTVDSGTAMGVRIEHDTFGSCLELHREHASNAPSITWSNDGGQIGILYATDTENELRWRDGTSTNTHLIFHGGNSAQFTSALNTKLSGIETGATADQTASEILTAIKTVDGTGSGLDADTLDGYQSGQFLRSDTADTASGIITYSNTQKFLGNTFWQVSSSDTAIQRADARDDATTRARLHWYGQDSSGTNTNFRHAWYDGSAYVNVDVANQVVSFSGGLSASGNITVTGTVDGRDVATDGTKLDGISAGANVTPSWVPSSDPSYATQSYVNTQVSNLVDSAPSSLDTLNELAAALGDDANFSTTVTNSIATKLPLAGGTLTGNLTIGSTTDSTKIVFPDKNIADNPTAAGDDRQLISMGNSGAGGLFQTTGRGGLMLASADDSVIIASGDVGRNYDPDAGSWNPNPDDEEIYLLTDGSVRFRTNLQTVASYKEFIFDNSGNATIPGNITVSGTVDGVDIAARDSVLTSTTTTANAALARSGGTMTGTLTAVGQVWNGDITWNSGKNILVAGESSIDVSGSGYFQIWDSGTAAPFLKCDVGQTVEIGQAGDRGLLVHGKISGGSDHDTTPDAELHIKSSAVGTTAGNEQELARFSATNSNASHLRIYKERDTAGSDWTTAYTRIQQRIDTTDMGYIQFNGTDNTYGIEMGTNGDEKFAMFRRNAEVELYYDNVEKFATTSTGVNVVGALTATTKSFDIEHPSKEGMRLRYGSLEGPENGVYVRGKSKEKVISLPDYWVDLVHEDSITVQLTAIGGGQNLYVEEIKDNKVYVNGENYFYYIQAERKDVERFEVEYESDL